MYEWCGVQLEPEHSKNNQNTASRLCDKEENYTNEKYLSWEHERFEQFKTFVLACRSDKDKKYIIRIHRNLPEWPGTIPRSNKNGQFIHVRE